jgi:hypothetical protein
MVTWSCGVVDRVVGYTKRTSPDHYNSYLQVTGQFTPINQNNNRSNMGEINQQQRKQKPLPAATASKTQAAFKAPATTKAPTAQTPGLAKALSALPAVAPTPVAKAAVAAMPLPSFVSKIGGI